MFSRDFKRNGFTLIEVLASVAVLAILVLALGRMFTEASDAYARGSTIASRNATARNAMEMISQDIEQSIIDPRISMYHEGDVISANFDVLYLVTMGDAVDDDRSYQQIRYYVAENNSKGYTTWRLMRGVRSFATALSDGVDVLSTTNYRWWAIDNSGFENDMLVENVVRFDVFMKDKDSHLVSTASGTIDFGGSAKYESSIAMDRSADPAPSAGGFLPIDTPPGYVDIYLQVTSEDVMRRARLAIDGSSPARGYSLLYRESNVLFSRITPMMWWAQRVHPLSAY